MNYRAIVERIVKPYDLPREKDAAFAECLDYARNDLLYPQNNQFLQVACGILQHYPVRLSILDSIGWDASTHLRVYVSEEDRVEIQGDAEGLRQLARLCQLLSEIDEEEQADLEPETELVGDSFPVEVARVESEKFILPDDPETTSEYIASPLRPDEIFAIQFLGPLPEGLDLTAGRIYRVRGITPTNAEQDVFGFDGGAAASERYSFLLRSDAGMPVNVVLDLYDENINFISREEVAELLEEE